MTSDSATSQTPVFTPAGGGTVVWSMGNRFTFKLRAGESAHALGLLEVVAPVGSAPPLHVHHREVEVFVLLEGSMLYQAGDAMYELTPGSSIYLPVGVRHGFRVTGPSPARFLALTLPGGIEDLYEEIGRPAGGPGLPEPPTQEEIAAWLAVNTKYGLEVVGPPIQERGQGTHSVSGGESPG
jgi:mannose-6-phosphate isomerase-like protein (cupin superfamily)